MFKDEIQDQISLCIIDDIRSVVDGLTAIDWDDNGITLHGTAANGSEGLEILSRVKPDLIITDIRMPKMDGLTMLRQLLETNHACKVILISGYADFEYAQQAVQLGAYDFVVKPFTEEEILSVVLRAKAEILKERSEKYSHHLMESKLRESMPVLRQEYLSMLVHHRTTWAHAAERWDFLGVDLEPQGFIVMLIEIDKFREKVAELSIREVELIRFSLQNIVEETIGHDSRCVVIRAKNNRFLALMNDVASRDATLIAESCCRNIEKFTKFTVSIGVSGQVQQTHQLPDAYREAERALAYHIFSEGNAAIGIDDLPETGSQSPLSLERKDELLLALRTGNGERAIQLLCAISAQLQSLTPPPHPDYLLSLYDELAASVIRALHELAPFAEVQPLITRYKSMRGTTGMPLSSLEQQLSQLCREGAAVVGSNTLSESQKIIYRSLEFIQSRLGEEVTLTECAAHVHLSVSYYSSLFKKVTGMTITQYVNQERIRLAKTLLVEGKSVQEVSAAVGYEERRYFSEMFKRVTGMTPTEFRSDYHPDPPEEAETTKP
ncbi:MAG: response regulator [Paenibacillus sp.]|uniref:response regulator n=1 Tax=Paenibacillus sp. TaxID=58172 RepID=UPI0029154D29|nr:response regulator [Paenibacillus sp.]MDU4697532.1 response regulator [Paenibacillus sp.]